MSSYELRTLARAIRPLGTWWGLVPGLLLLLATSRSARRRWWLWGVAFVAAPLAGEALREFVGRALLARNVGGYPFFSDGQATFVTVSCAGP